MIIWQFAGVTQPGTIQWLNPDAFVSTIDPSTGACVGGNSPANCQFGNLGRNALRGPDFVWSDLYLTKWFPVRYRARAVGGYIIAGSFSAVLGGPISTTRFLCCSANLRR